NLVARGERSHHTYDGYVRFLSSADQRFGHVRSSELEPLQVYRWCEEPGLDWNQTTRANAITAVKAAYRWGRKRGFVRIDPVRDMDKPTPRRRQAVLTEEQVLKILEATAGTSFADLITALWETGCRPAEVMTLTADRADPDRGIWRVVNKTRTST